MSERRRVILGQLGAAHGVKGLQKINSYTNPKKNILKYDSWLIGKGDRWTEVKWSDQQVRGEKVLARLEGVESPEKAQQYTGYRIAVYRDEMPEANNGEYYWTDLEGCDVFNLKEEHLGTVDHMMETGSNDVMILTGGRETCAVPFRKDDVIKKVNLAEKKILVDWDNDY